MFKQTKLKLGENECQKARYRVFAFSENTFTKTKPY